MENIFRFIHKPKHVAVVSIVIAAIIGYFGYQSITKVPENQFVKAQAGVIQNVWNSSTSTKGTVAKNLTLSFLTSGRIQSVSVKAGDVVKDGDVLAIVDLGNTEGALTQSEAAYDSAVANYNKLVNGATSNDVAVSNVSVDISKNNLIHNKENLVIGLNNSLTTATNAVNNNTNILFDNPNTENPSLITKVISFTNEQLENNIVSERTSINRLLISWKQEISGIDENSNLDKISNNTLNYLQSIATYLDDLNNLFTLYASVGNSASQSILSNDQGSILSARASITGQITTLTNNLQIVSASEKSLEQSQAVLNQKVSSARPEDLIIAKAQIESARGAVQIAEVAYNNHLIVAPGDGVVTAVYVTTGQTATQGLPAIDFSGKTFSKDVAIMIPNNSIINRNGNSYVWVKSGNSTEEKEIVVGVKDATNTEVLSGISIGDEVVIH